MFDFRLFIYFTLIICQLLIFQLVTVNSEVFSLLAFASLFVVVHKGENKLSYLIYLNVVTFFGLLSVAEFSVLNHSFFDAGGDDKRFFYQIQSAIEDGGVGERLGNLRYSGFITLHYFGALLFTKWIPVFSFTPMYVYGFSWALFANVLVFAKRLLERMIGRLTRRALFLLFVLMSLPHFLRENVKLMREPIVALILLFIFYLLFAKKKLSIHWVYITLLGMLVLIVRAEVILMISFMIGIYVFTKNKKYRYIYTFFTILLGVIVILFVDLPYVWNDVSEYRNTYIELRSGAGGEESLGVKLKTLGLVGLLPTALYLWISPFPPPILLELSLRNILFSISILFWIYWFTRFCLFVYKSRKYIEIKDKLIFFACILYSVFIAFTSGDSRHISFIYPFVIILMVKYRTQIRWRATASFVVVSLMLLYVLMKYVI